MCRRHFNEQEKFEKNNKKENCEDPDIIMPETGSKIQFKNIAKQMKVLYCIIADFESYNEKFTQKKGKQDK